MPAFHFFGVLLQRTKQTNRIMKKFLWFSLLCLCGVGLTFAQARPATEEKKAELKFDKLVHNFGTFPENDALVKCTFTFTNVGTAPLIIHQAIASCGCTVPVYTKTPVKPGEKGQIDVTYNGAGRFPGRFKKSITVRCNGKQEMVRLFIEGNMTEAEPAAEPVAEKESQP